MTDREWYSKILLCKKALTRHLELLMKVQDEYVRRYGKPPFEVSDEAWVAYLERDSLDSMTLEEIKENAYDCRRRHEL